MCVTCKIRALRPACRSAAGTVPRYARYERHRAVEWSSVRNLEDPMLLQAILILCTQFCRRSPSPISDLAARSRSRMHRAIMRATPRGRSALCIARAIGPISPRCADDTADAHWAHCGLRLLAVRARATAPSTQHSRGRCSVVADDGPTPPMVPPAGCRRGRPQHEHPSTALQGGPVRLCLRGTGVCASCWNGKLT